MKIPSGTRTFEIISFTTMHDNNKTLQEPRSITGRIGAGGKRVVDSIVNLLASLDVHPNILTLIGMVINIFAMVLFAKGIFTWAALVIIFAGIFDIVDGEVARRTHRVTKFGAFFDSVIDRYSDLLLLLGLIIWYAQDQPHFLRRSYRSRPHRLHSHELHTGARRIAHSGLQGGISRKT